MWPQLDRDTGYPQVELFGVTLTYNALPVDVASGSCPEVRLWDVTTPSGVFQSKVVVHRLAEFLLAAEIAFRCLNRGVPKQKLNLFKFSARQMA